MKLGMTAAATGLALLTLLTDNASAQVPYRHPSAGSARSASAPSLRSSRPTVSPYLNLLSGRGVGTEYYGRVRPQQEFRRTAAALGRSIQDLEAAQSSFAQPEQAEIGATGHAATFMSHHRYFGVSTTPQAAGSARSPGQRYLRR